LSFAEIFSHIRAIVFDFDGTILDTEQYDYQAWQEVYDQHGAHLPFDLWAHQIGTVSHDFDPYHLLQEQIGRLLDRQQIGAQRRQRFLQLVAQEPLRPGVAELIAIAQRASWGLGVASSGTREWVEGHLLQRNLRHHFHVVRTSNDVQRVKPHPELYLTALTALGVEPSHAVAIEDSRNGMLAAKQAGMKCIIIPNRMTQRMDFSEADLLLDSLADLHMEI
jgi:HAD superfamily hydrolase (TIGR01509 family)